MAVSPDPQAQTHRWTRRQYEQMVEAHVLTAEDRVELLNGRIVPMSPQNSRHATAVTLCHQALSEMGPEDHFVRTQAPLALGPHSEPEPDVALVPGTPADYWTQHPDRAALIVEVSDASLEKDRSDKRRLYARHGVPEYWILNLQAGHIEVYRHPSDDDYETKTTHPRNDSVATAARPEASVSVSRLIPTS